MKASKRTLMCAPPVLMLLADATLTLTGQAPEYWTDGYAFVREDNPLARRFLELHPMVFVAGLVVWLTVVATAIHRLPLGLARVTAFAVMIGHAFGAASWLLRWPFGLVAVVVLLFGIRLMDRLIWDWDESAGVR